MTAKSKNKHAPRPLRKAIDAVAVIIDGETEEWYIKQIKEKYNPDATRALKITPEFPEKKTVQELFDFAEKLIETEEFTKVFLIIDLDEVLKDAGEWMRFKKFYLKSKEPSKRFIWMKKLEVIINTPCLEYWYLLHFKQTKRFFENYDHLKPYIRKNPELSGYEKTDAYYNNIPKIYDRLAAHLSDARSNAFEFDLEKASEQGCSEMFKFFDYIDKKLP